MIDMIDNRQTGRQTDIEILFNSGSVWLLSTCILSEQSHEVVPKTNVVLNHRSFYAKVASEFIDQEIIG